MTPCTYPTHPDPASLSCQEIAVTGQAAIASSQSDCGYSTPSLTRESHSSSIKNTSPAITAQELQPIQVELTCGFFTSPLSGLTFSISIIYKIRSYFAKYTKMTIIGKKYDSSHFFLGSSLLGQNPTWPDRYPSLDYIFWGIWGQYTQCSWYQFSKRMTPWHLYHHPADRIL